ncbi:Long-chain-fatty-acid--CoA ligase [Labilithrix luteola]|uniref:Long-chain-fatty-acid--CoA ligase n=1 Tax=Labilithrix luteola TaxID=1391654 RepID=A0A0K1PNT5_9BACT|nr:AMP-dependent synthetase/ligase [Labilithrix luteola]AKU95188.1 Long-chain-fatty-acid--CoA ligase [Labilithrix luteola]
MDISRFLDLRIAPRAVFDALEERKTRARFMVPTAPGSNEWRPVTWGAFAQEIRELALFLSTVLSSGDRGAVYAPNRVEWASAALAIQAAGGVIVPIYPASTPDQLSYVASHSDAKVIFVDTAPLLTRLFATWNSTPGVEKIVVLDDGIDVARVYESAREKGIPVPSLDAVERKVLSIGKARGIGAARDQEDPQAFERTMAAISLDQAGMMLYTSGTSGNPKGVPLTHRNVAVNGLDWLKCNYPLLEEGDVDILWLPMSHIFGFGEMCLGNTLGWTSYLADPATCLGRLPEVTPNIFMSVPSHWEKLALMAMHEPTPQARLDKFKAATGGKLRFCLSGGAGLKREVKDFFYSCGVLIVEGYGLTETSPTLTLNRPDAFRFDTVGKTLPSVELRLADDGEILARGASVFGGYHKDPEATREAFTEDGWFKTGDVGRFTDDGFLQIIDRKKDILVTAGGKNVPPANIEIRFQDDPLFAHVVVYGDAKKYLVAGVWLNEEAMSSQLASVPKDQQESARRDLVQKRIDHVNASLASYETIKKFSIIGEPLTVEAGLLTPSLKMRRKKVYEHFHGIFEGMFEDTQGKGAASSTASQGSGA